VNLSNLEFMLNGSDVRRYHTVRTLAADTVGHHSHGVALLCLLMVPDATAELLTAALVHDLAEQKTGDIPSPAKRLYGIGDQVSRVEESLLKDGGFPLPDLEDWEYRTLKLADIAHGALFCIREIQLGNHKMADVYHRYMSYAWDMMPVHKEYKLFKLIGEMYANESK